MNMLRRIPTTINVLTNDADQSYNTIYSIRIWRDHCDWAKVLIESRHCDLHQPHKAQDFTSFDRARLQKCDTAN